MSSDRKTKGGKKEISRSEINRMRRELNGGEGETQRGRTQGIRAETGRVDRDEGSRMRF